jgi:putative protease
MTLMSPAGSPRAARAALRAGADAIYLGLRDLTHQRDQCRNFTSRELDEVVELARAHGRRTYVTFNSSYNEADYSAVLSRIGGLAGRGVTGVIISDLGLVAEVCRAYPELEVEYSVQGQCANEDTAKLLAELGVRRLVLDRNVTIAEAAAIREASGLEVVLFGFGFLCYSQDSICYLGDHFSGMPCKVHCTQMVSFEQGIPRAGPGRHLFMKYYSALPALALMAGAGIHGLKLEGRHRSSSYVARVTRVFREALDEVERCRLAGVAYRPRPSWQTSLRIAALGFEVTEGSFAPGRYSRRTDSRPPWSSPPLFLADTLLTFLESRNIMTLRHELSAAWDRLRRRPGGEAPPRGRGFQGLP